MLGRESAIESASVEASGGRIVLVESEGSNAVDMVSNLQELNERFLVMCGNVLREMEKELLSGEGGCYVWLLRQLGMTKPEIFSIRLCSERSKRSRSKLKLVT